MSPQGLAGSGDARPHPSPGVPSRTPRAGTLPGRLRRPVTADRCLQRSRLARPSRYARVMDTYERILKLRAIRDYEDRMLSDEDLNKILEAARWTGSSKNLQNWSFVVVSDPAQKSRLAAAGNFTVPITNAPVAVAIVEEPGGYEFDSGRVAQNIMLAADAIGVASCPITLHLSLIHI